MDTKVCGTCKTEKSISEFYKNKTKSDGLSSYCKDCKKQYNRIHYIERGWIWKDARAKQRADHRQKSQKSVCDYLSNHPCVDCGEVDIVVLEFDHIKDKDANIGSKIGQWPKSPNVK